MSYLIGLDIGTSQIKAVLFDREGNELAVASRQTSIESPAPRFMEQDMEQVWAAAVDCLISLRNSAPEAMQEVQAVGVSGQGEGLWLLDRNGRPVQPAILWNDGRSADTVANLSPQMHETIRQVTMTTPNTSSTLIQLKWMSEYRPDVLKQAAHCVFCKDWIRFKLTGQIHCEKTDTSVTLMNMRSHTMATEAFSLLGLEEYLDLFPALLDSADGSGTITPAAAAETGLPAGIPVAAGALDVTATCLGVQAIQENELFLILGTTACSGLVVSPESADPDEGKYLLHPGSDYFIKIMATMAGTPNMDWLLKAIAPDADYADLEQAVRDTGAGSGGVLYFPYISPAGERYPFYHPYAKASFFGLTASITRSQIIRAVYEGVGFSIKDCLFGENTAGRIHIAGGGSKSDLWCQIIADCTAHEIVRYKGNEMGAKGAAILAGLCAGWHPDLASMASTFCHEEKLFAPNPHNVKIYEDLFSVYRSVRSAQTDIWTEHQRILNLHSMQ